MTGIGSVPGTDADEAAALVFGELPDLPHLAELPARGPGSQLIGRTAALLVDLPVEIVPTGWRLTAHPGRDLQRARDDLARDLDAVERAGEGYAGPFKMQAVGPLTLAAGIELPGGHAVLTDSGALRDLIESLTEGVGTHLRDVVARLPAADPILQLDEPGLPAALAGAIPTASGYGTLRPVEASTAEEALAAVLGVAAPGRRVVHCCAAGVPIPVLRSAAVDAVALDAGLLTREDYDALGEAVDAGVSLWLGLLDPLGPADRAAARQRLDALWNELGFATGDLADAVVPTPACGLAGARPASVGPLLATLRDLGRSLADDR